MRSISIYTIIFLSLLGIRCEKQTRIGHLEVKPTQEYVMADNTLYTPSTQSMLRTHSWLEEVPEIDFLVSDKDLGTIQLKQERDGNYLNIVNLPMGYLVPRLHYNHSPIPDEFDALNLRLAEFSRNSISVPFGRTKDEMAHYETNLTDNVPWKLAGDFNFVPNKFYKPLRVGVVNNCLRSGLWELNAVDRSGEIYHSWFQIPQDYYFALVAKVNKLDKQFVEKATLWDEKEVKLILERLRDEKKSLGNSSIEVIDRAIGYSSQDSRRKIGKNFVFFKDENGNIKSPGSLSDLYKHPTFMANFEEPGIYSTQNNDRKQFDFGFLSNPKNVEVKIVEPKTNYDWQKKSGRNKNDRSSYIEMDIELDNDEHIIIGNLPLKLLVEQEDFFLHGFGVGILSPGDYAERRNFLISDGPCPSYAYLATKKGEDFYGINSHARGLEQIFIRSHPNGPSPYWDVIITSFERIVDLVNYKIKIPDQLVPEQKRSSEHYVSPIYFTYRDDNVN